LLVFPFNLDTDCIIGAFIELLMVDNTRMKEIQGELKRISKTLGLHQERFMQMDQRFEKIDQHLLELQQLFLKSQNESPVQPSTSIVSHPRSMKLDFPRFTGDDTMTWLYKAEKFFTLYNTLDEQKVAIASIHFEGKVLPWFQLLEKAHQVPDWLSLSTAIQIQFGPSQFDNPRSDLFKLKQSSTVADYYVSFTELANRSYGLDDSVLLDCFIGGLIPELKRIPSPSLITPDCVIC